MEGRGEEPQAYHDSALSSGNLIYFEKYLKNSLKFFHYAMIIQNRLKHIFKFIPYHTKIF